MLTDGRMSGRLKYDLSDALSAKLQTSKEPGFSQVMMDLDYKGLDTQAQLKLGNGQFYGINYLQSVSNTLALGGEGFWLGGQRKSGVGFAARQGRVYIIHTGGLTWGERKGGGGKRARAYT